jgi:hypothetical protein
VLGTEKLSPRGRAGGCGHLQAGPHLVHDLVADSGIEFLESRDGELKGLDGTHRLFAVTIT